MSDTNPSTTNITDHTPIDTMQPIVHVNEPPQSEPNQVPIAKPNNKSTKILNYTLGVLTLLLVIVVAGNFWINRKKSTIDTQSTDQTTAMITDGDTPLASTQPEKPVQGMGLSVDNVFAAYIDRGIPVKQDINNSNIYYVDERYEGSYGFYLVAEGEYNNLTKATLTSYKESEDQECTGCGWELLHFLNDLDPIGGPDQEGWPLDVVNLVDEYKLDLGHSLELENIKITFEYIEDYENIPPGEPYSIVTAEYSPVDKTYEEFLQEHNIEISK